MLISIDEEKMNKHEIFEKSNLYKRKYNKLEKNASDCKRSLYLFDKYKKFFSIKEKETKSFKKKLLTLGVVLSPLALLSIFISYFAAIPFVVGAVVIWERFFFFKKISKKFSHCHEILSNITNNLSQKETNFQNEKTLTMAKIIELENAIPEEVKQEIEKIETEIVETEESIQIQTL